MIDSHLDQETLGPEAYRQLFQRLQDGLRRRVAEIGAEVESAERQLELLLALSPGEQLLVIRGGGASISRALAQHLLDLCRECWVASPAEAEGFAYLALEVIDQLDGAQPAVSDLRAQRWAYLGNARRIQSDFRSAEDAFTLARSFLDVGSSDLLLRAEIFDLEASLRQDQRRLDEARRLLNRAANLYRRTGDDHRLGRVMMKQAMLTNDAGHPDLAIGLLRQASDLIDTEREPRLRNTVIQQLVYLLREAGRQPEAIALLPQARAAVAQFGTRSDALRLSWTEALLAADLGNWAEAEHAFREVRSGFIEEGIGYDAALVSLDLAHLYLSRGRTAETRRLAAEMLPIFQSRDIHREALAALMVFYRAAEIDRVTTSMIEQIAACVRRIRPSQPVRAERPS